MIFIIGSVNGEGIEIDGGVLTSTYGPRRSESIESIESKEPNH